MKSPALVALLLVTATMAARAQNTTKLSDVVAFSAKGTVEGVDAKGVRTVYQPSFDGTAPDTTTVVATAMSSATTETRKPGTSLVTGEDSAASLHLGAAGGARMGTATEVSIPKVEETRHSLELLKGRLFLNISGDELKKRNAEFKLKTPAALLAVKGTKFYATSMAGEDTIGVHVGKVVVQDSGGKGAVELGEGTVVTVGPTGISVPRQMTVEEKAAVADYDAASVIRMPLRQAARAGATPAAPEMVWSALERYKGNRRIRGQEPPAVIAVDGTARFTWPLEETVAAEARHLTTGKCLGLAGLKSPLIGLELRLRVVGASSLGLKIALQDAPDAATEISVTPVGAEWVDVMIPFPVSPGNAGFKNGLIFTASITPASRDGKTATVVKLGGLEIQSANLVCSP